MIDLHKAGFRYGSTSKPVLSDISLTIEAGERVCIVGANASGASTLLAIAAGALDVTEGTSATDGSVGYVPQDPRQQFVSTLVFDEVAFGLRNTGIAHKKIKPRVVSALENCGVRRLANCSTAELSGARQVLVALAAASAIHPHNLILDDVFAMLDNATAAHIAALIDSHVGQGACVLEATHSLIRAMGADRICVLADGTIAWMGTFEDLLGNDDLLARAGFGGDPLVPLLRAVEREGFRFAPGTTEEHLASYITDNRLAGHIAQVVAPRHVQGTDTPAHLLALDGTGIVYDTKPALSGVSLEIDDELVLVIGPAGSGKSTLAAALAGVLPLDDGAALLDGERVRAGRVGYVGQFASDQLIAAPRGRKIDAYSVGEAKLAMISGIEALRPAAWILDEPLAGLDADNRAKVRRSVEHARAQHLPVVIATSDPEPWFELASRVFFMRSGQIAYGCDAQAAQTRTQPFKSYGLEPPLPVSVRTLAGMGSRRGGDRG